MLFAQERRGEREEARACVRAEMKVLCSLFGEMRQRSSRNKRARGENKEEMKEGGK